VSSSMAAYVPWSYCPTKPLSTSMHPLGQRQIIIITVIDVESYSFLYSWWNSRMNETVVDSFLRRFLNTLDWSDSVTVWSCFLWMQPQCYQIAKWHFRLLITAWSPGCNTLVVPKHQLNVLQVSEHGVCRTVIYER
jgi:hypothetical protein